MSDPKIDTVANGADSLLQAARQSQAEGLKAWGRACDAYTEYMVAVAKARTPAALFAANAGLFRDTVSAFANGEGASKAPGG